MNEGAPPLSSLRHFPRIPRAGEITVAESHSEIHTQPSQLANPSTGRGFYPQIDDYHAIDGHQLKANLPFKIPSVKLASSRKSLLIERSESVSKTLWDAWWEDGVKGVNRSLAEAEASRELSSTSRVMIKIAGSATNLCVQLFTVPSRFFTFLFPHLELKVEELNEKFSPVRRWKESWVRAIAWNPSFPYLAVALDDDSVRCSIVGKDSFSMLRCQEQQNVSCLSWRPYIKADLAVGCADCIVIWHLTSSATMRAGRNKTTIIKAPRHGPVNCVQYANDGYFLLSSSSYDTSVYLWDACMWSNAPLRRIGGGGIPLALWAPKCNRIVAASPSKTFWIWENNNKWVGKRWSTPKTRIEAACWDPTGTTLIFATGGIIYGMFFALSPVDRFVSQTDSIVKPIFNIEECHVFDEDENLEYKVGGKVTHLEMDRNGHRVAVMFEDSEVIALFRVLPHAGKIVLTPLGFLRGHPDECPLAMTFQKNFTDGALLTVAWSSGRIQYFPMIFALPTTNRNLLHENHYRSQQVLTGQPSHFTAAGFVSPKMTVSGVEPAKSRASDVFFQQEQTSPSRLYSLFSTSKTKAD